MIELLLADEATRRVQEFFRHSPITESWPWWHWNAHPLVARTINRRVTGDPNKTLLRALTELLPQLGLALPVARAASLGCGRGRLDRGLYRLGIVKTRVGFDVSPDSIEAAGNWARSAGIPAFEYRLADLNDIELDPESFDLLVAEMSLHHTFELERLFDVIAHALKPGGLLIVDEYVGPTRFRWTERQMQTVNGLLMLSPPKNRITPDGTFKPPIEHRPPSFFEQIDPSESIRSGEVLSCLEQRFEVRW